MRNLFLFFFVNSQKFFAILQFFSAILSILFCNSFQFFQISSAILFNCFELILQFFCYSSHVFISSAYLFTLNFPYNSIKVFRFHFFPGLIFHISFFLLFCPNSFHFVRAILSTSFEFCSVCSFSLSFSNGNLILSLQFQFLPFFVLGKIQSDAKYTLPALFGRLAHCSLSGIASLTAVVYELIWWGRACEEARELAAAISYSGRFK